MILNFIFCLIFTYFGAYIGRLISFLEKDERMPNFKKIIAEIFKCHNCNTINIPIVSFIIKGGVCRKCNNKLNYEQFILELLSAILFLILYIHYGFSLKFIFAILMTIAILAISYMDIKYMVAPIYLQIYIGFCALLYILFNPIDLLFSIFCALIYFSVIFVCSILLKDSETKKIIGDADKILFAICGLVLRLRNLPKFLTITGIIGLITFVIFNWFFKKNEEKIFPFTPAILASLVICLIF